MDNLQTQDTPQPAQTAPVAVYQPPAVIPNNTVPPDSEEPKALTLDDLKAMGIIPEDYQPADRHGMDEFHIDMSTAVDIDDMKSWDD